jgi:hypothetical protein
MANYNSQEKNSLVGQTVGRLTVLKRVPNPNTGGTSPNARWRVAYHCQCACGNEIIAEKSNLKSGNTNSCGCYHSERSSARHPHHSLTHLSELRAWRALRNRCTNPSNREYPLYGGRGITFDPNWDTFEKFLADVGAKPGPEYSLDRWPDNDGNYIKSNVRWALAEDQANNTRRNKHLTLDGVTHTVAQWSRISGISYFTISRRIGLGWSDEKVLSTPVRLKKSDW